MKKINDSILLIYIKGVKKINNFYSDFRGDSEFNDGGTSNWIRNVAIGFAIASVLFLLVKSFMPELFNSWKGKVMEWFN